LGWSFSCIHAEGFQVGLVSPENKPRYPVYTRDVEKEGQRIMAHGAIVGVVPMEDGVW
jgi:hypothetical protein